MKILYVGNQNDPSGYGYACRNNILAMDSVGLDVVPRKIKFSNTEVKNQRIEELEKKSQEGCEVCIQHTLPFYFVADNRFKKNIGCFAWETDKIPISWVKNCNLMNEIWVINHQMFTACKNSGVKPKICVVPHAFDMDAYSKIDTKGLEYLNNGTFKFYTIGEFTRRKNFAALIKAFHLEFCNAEGIDLVIKSNKEGVAPQDLKRELVGFCTEMKRGLKLYGNNLAPYRQEIIITDYLSDDKLRGLHSLCHCFVSPSYGEAWNIGCFDSLAFGNIPLATDCTGHKDYISDRYNGYLINSRLEPVFGMNESFPDIYSGFENWWSADINYLRKLMRKVYNLYVKSFLSDTPSCEYSELRENGPKTVQEFSFQKIGDLIKNLLE